MKRHRILVDTDLLVLLTVGTASDSFIGAHKRTKTYTVDDFVLLKSILADAARLITTPNILSETSNLIRQFAMPGRARVIDAFRDIAASARETYVPSVDAMARWEFENLGLTDASILAARDEDFVVITDDVGLYIASISAGRDALNFTHERQRRLI